MKRFETNKKYGTGGAADGAILVVKRTAKYLLVGLPNGDVKWVMHHEGDGGEYAKLAAGGRYEARNVVADADDAAPEEFGIKKGDLVETPRFLKVVIEKVFKSEANARKQGYTEPTDYDNGAYGILGKYIGESRMAFAAYVKQGVRDNGIV